MNIKRLAKRIVSKANWAALTASNGKPQVGIDNVLFATQSTTSSSA